MSLHGVRNFGFWTGVLGVGTFFGGRALAVFLGAGLDAVGADGVGLSHEIVSYTDPTGIGVGLLGVLIWGLAHSAQDAGHPEHDDHDHD